MSFDKYGYLGNQINDISSDLEKRHSEAFSIAYEINEFSHKVKFEFNVGQDNLLQVVATSLFIKILNNFQAIILLSRLGLESEAKIITRTLLDALFVLKAIIDDEKELVKFINIDFINRERLINYILKREKDNPYLHLHDHIDENLLTEIKEFIKQNKIKDIKTSEWAKKADLLNFYKFPYQIYNSEVHPDIRSLEKYIKTDEYNNVLKFDIFPSDKDLNATLKTSCGAMLISLENMIRLFDLEHSKKVSDLERKIVNIKI